MTEDAGFFFLLLFLAVVFISQALILPAAGNKAKHKELTKRLQDSQSDLDDETRSLLNDHYLKGLSPLDRKLVSFKTFASLKRSIELSGYQWSLSSVLGVGLVLSLAIVLFLIAIEQPFYVALIAFCLVWACIHFYFQHKIAQRLSAFEEQLPEALDIMRRMLQAGQPISQAFGEVGREMPAPIGPEFTNTFNLLNYGYDMRLAIMQMAERTPTVSMLAFSSAVLLQKETGGNLSENIEKVSQVLRARFKLARKIKSISAESRLSAWILVLSPFVLFLGMSVMHPDYVEPLLTDPRGSSLIIYGVISLCIGSLWIRNIVNFEV
ncbi:type II secretion system F family protein [Vibrio astriarenae]|jgi:tight adherence protein B|uniref:type II secretion system F family protein n=1 Tax=Vibrio agarivorans TaxID=153622 RepID=UPI0025B59B11|nr:type II secretion system F family protein [Vibrio agarivorans]MDN3662611.1 type II secretion system F family protein [Vibrio agarivorans]